MSVVLAICDGVSGSTRVTGILVPPLIVALWGALLYVALRRVSLDDRMLILGAFVAAGLLAGGIFFLPEGVSGDGDYLARFFLALLAGVAIPGVAGALARREHAWRMLAAALLGAVSLPGIVVLLFVWSLALSGGCIG